MPLKNLNFLPFLGAAVSIAGMLHYVLYESWIGVINLGLGLIIALSSKTRKSKKEKPTLALKIMDAILLVALLLNFILSIRVLFQGDFKRALLFAEISVIFFIETFVLERRK